ncbi:uncharacterized protein LOC133336755, partial [Musca vetustissima]|uniref:uncharacterized protein LOC133336755 n=1 Tax=Musca vetustissima TaxID=27455 RepID=UPI002AB78677
MERYPLGSQMLKDNFYMDDGLCGADSLSTAIEIQKELVTILKQHGFILRKWSSNTPRLLKNIPHSDREIPTKIQLHVFADASERAFGAAIYIRFIGKDGRVVVCLICAKSKVAPLKKQTLPRLELCATVVAAQLKLNSTSSQKKTLPTFYPEVSRQLIFLNADYGFMVQFFFMEKKNYGRPNSLRKRSYKEFWRTCLDMQKAHRPQHIAVSPSELDDSLRLIVQAVQSSEFAGDINALKAVKQINKHSSLCSLSPFLDDEGILRVGGRLEHAMLQMDAKHQMILPYNDPLVKLLFKICHEENKHCGAQALLNTIRQRFWPIKGKITAWSTVQKCIKCNRARPQLYQQIMGNLPATRVVPARPFINSGV